MQSKSDSWLVPSWRRVCWFCRGRGSNVWRDGFSLALEVVPVEAELARRRGEAVLRCLHRLCPARSGSTRILRDSALALLPAAARGCSGALLCSFAVLLRVLICGLCRVTLYPDHPFPFSVRVNFVSMFTGVKFKKKKIIVINWTGYRNSNFDFTLHHLANKSAAIVLPFPELGVVAEIKHLTKRTQPYCFRAAEGWLLKAEWGVWWLFLLWVSFFAGFIFSSRIFVLVFPLFLQSSLFYWLPK